jgi:tetratricopeptide (TPR) repeat protein
MEAEAPDMFASFVADWEQSDRSELERRTSGWYFTLAERLSDQPSLGELRSAIEGVGQFDGPELLRTIRELTVRAIDDNRPAEHALLAFLHTAVSRVLATYYPAPPSGFANGPDEIDVHAAISANALKPYFEVMLQNATELLAEGRYTDCLSKLEELHEKVAQLPDDQRRFLRPAELLGVQLAAEDIRAQALFKLDRLDEALVSYESTAQDALIGGASGLSWFDERRFRFQALSGVARIALRRGQPDAATEISRELARFSASIGQPAYERSALNNIGIALLALGRPGLALQQFRRARAIITSTGPSGFSTFGEADALRELGDEVAATAIYNEELRRGSETDNWPMILLFADRVARGVISPDAQALAILTQARAEAEAVGSIPAELGLMTALVVARSRTGLGAALIASAKDVLDRANAIEPYAPALLKLRVLIARALLQPRGGSPQSEHDAEAQLQTVLDAVERLATRTPLDERRAEIAGDWIDAYGAMITLRLGTDTEVSRAFGLHESTKARALAARLGGALPIAPPGCVPRALVDREQRTRRAVLSLQDASGGARSERYRLERLISLRTELREIEDEIEGMAPDYVSARRGDPPTMTEVGATLRDMSPVATGAVSFFVDRDATIAFVIRSDVADVTCHRLALTREALLAATAELQREFNGSVDEGYPRIRRNQPWLRPLPIWESVSRAFGELVDSLDGLASVVIAPHGPLHLLPLHALRAPDGSFLIERFSVSYTPSLTALSQALLSPSLERDVARTAYVAAVAAREDRHPEYFEHDDALFGVEGWSCAADLGPALASRERVLSGIVSSEIVHLTCHGIFSPGLAQHTGLLFSDGRDRPIRNVRGLPLARRMPFLISLPDLSGRSLRARLVTLRACSTGLHRMRNAGDEFEGLARAMLEGGARATLVSLWNVDQQSSYELLSRFYRELLANDSVGLAQALAAAQRELIRSDDRPLTHQYHWAPFALIGDWR